MADDAGKWTGVRPRAPGGRKRPTGGLQARMRALGAVGEARVADNNDPQPACAHAMADGPEVHCTCKALLEEVGGISMMCIGKRCGHADLPRPGSAEDEAEED